MQRFKQYVDQRIHLNNIKDANRLASFGMICRYLPDPPEDFDEFEFVSDYRGQENLGLMVTVEKEKIKRIFFGMISPDNPDVVRPLTTNELKELLDEKGAKFLRFFDYITQ
jgi:hypothetical protein